MPAIKCLRDGLALVVQLAGQLGDLTNGVDVAEVGCAVRLGDCDAIGVQCCRVLGEQDRLGLGFAGEFQADVHGESLCGQGLQLGIGQALRIVGELLDVPVELE